MLSARLRGEQIRLPLQLQPVWSQPLECNKAHNQKGWELLFRCPESKPFSSPKLQLRLSASLHGEICQPAFRSRPHSAYTGVSDAGSLLRQPLALR